MKRPSKEEYYLNISKEVCSRSTCLSATFGAVIVRDDQIIATGYNGAPRKTKDCISRGSCLRRELNIPSGHRYELCRSVHAEQNAIINAARSGVSLLGSDLYLYGVRVHGDKIIKIKAAPCFICKKMLINSGINRMITYDEDGTVKVYLLSDWTDDWKNKDMTEDMDIYDTKYEDKQSKNI